MTRHLWLGWRLARQTGYEARLRGALLFVGVLAVTFLALAGAAVPALTAHQHERVAAAALRYAGEDAATAGTDRASVPRGLDGDRLPDRRWGGHVVARTLVAIDPRNSPTWTIPGVDRLPGPGEAVLSPRLAREVQSDEVLGALVSTYTVVGTIGPEGLAAPDELRAVLGVPVTTANLEPVVGAGVAPPQETFTRVGLVVAVLSAVVTTVPAVAFVVLCARLGSRQRRSRLRGLRRLGMSRAAVRTVMVTESAVVAVPGALAGVAAFEAARFLRRVPGTSVSFFPDDLALPVTTTVLVLGAVLLVAAVACAAGVEVDGSRHDRGRVRRGGVLRDLGLLSVGLVLLLVGPAALSGGVTTALAMWTAIGLVALGAARASSWIGATACRGAARTVRRPGWFVGLRLASGEPGTPARVTALLAALVVGVAASVAFLSLLTGGVNARGGAPGSSVVAVSDHGRILDDDAVGSVDGVVVSVSVVDLEGDQDAVPAVTAVTCDELRTLLSAALDGCDEVTPTWLSRSGEPTTVSTSTSVTTPDGRELDLPPASSTLAAGGTDLVEGMLFVPALPDPPTGAARRYLVRIDGDAPAVLAAIVSRAPTASFDFGSGVAADTDSREYTGEISALVAAFVVAGFIAWLGLLTSVLGETAARRSQLGGLRVIGAPRSALAQAHVAAVATPVVAVTLVAVALGWVVTLRMWSLDDRVAVTPVLWVVLVTAGLATAALTALTTLPAALRAGPTLRGSRRP
ncbi:hypothetical protein QE364_003825 [Nocardioides zeae]|uniref:Uncharacterized protein n=1 Tax=Nocardioides zeae TaxID=1457234 RepID=A0ACC6IN35_9ACTN|nr:FtsX-like permease family protein [Nocardioides zeae]MDR6176044.1 hypothetical protein [Nocardioides zeae]MDR6212094.1 hypothetical protein [Nocardioides zeae]